MPLLTSVSYDPTLKTVTVAGDISTAALTSIINQTTGKNLFVVGVTPVTNRVFSGGNTTFTLNTDTTGDSATDVLVIRHQTLSLITSLADGTIINGVAHFVRSTNPTSRIDGAPLVVGDKNYRTDLKVDTFWNGMYWVSAQRFSLLGGWSGITTSIPLLAGIITTHLESATPVRFLLENLECFWQSLAPPYEYTVDNYWSINCYLFPTDTDAGQTIAINNVPLTSAPDSPYSTNQGHRQLIPINTAYLNDTYMFRQLICVRVFIIKTGTPATLTEASIKLNYRLIIP